MFTPGIPLESLPHSACPLQLPTKRTHRNRSLALSSVCIDQSLRSRRGCLTGPYACRSVFRRPQAQNAFAGPAGPGVSAAAAVAEAPTSAETSAPEVLSTVRFEGGMTVKVGRSDTSWMLDLHLESDSPTLLHWAINDWKLPGKPSWPANTTQVDDKAVQTRFDNHQIRIEFDDEHCPSRVVFVLKQTEPEKWLNNGGCDFAVMLRPPGVDDVMSKVLTAESEYTHWGLVPRFMLANETLDAADAAGAAGMAFMLVWMRLSTQKQLPWYKGSNFQSKDVAHIQKTLAQRMGDKVRSGSGPWARFFARLCLAGLPRGGGDGDAIRMGILHIMRENGIREGHRPGIEDKFLEQWHQKLHTNTTPEDITICEAYLHFLHCGDIGEMYRVLWENGRISREMLASMDKPITNDPYHLPQLIGPFKHFLWILKTCHSGADMDVALEMAKGYLDGDLTWNLYDLLSHRNEWWVPGKLVELRGRLEHYWRSEGAQRDILMLDIALDSYFRTCIERTDRSSLQGDDIVEMVTLVLKNAIIASENEDLVQCWRLWERLRSEQRWTPEWGLRALAAAQRTELALASFADTIHGLVQPVAARFQKVCCLNPAFTANFGEEIVRGQPLFVLSWLLQAVGPMLRSTAGVGNWLVTSQAEASGKLVLQPSLADIQGQKFDAPTIILANQVGGMEDIPENVRAVLTSSPTDVLSHVAIRARAQDVLLASCFAPEELQQMEALQGRHVSLSIDALGSVSATECEAAADSAGPAGSRAASSTNIHIPAPKATKEWVLAESGFAEGLCGGKSRNLATLRSKAPVGVDVPTSIVLPFGTFERVLATSENKQAASDLKSILSGLGKSGSNGSSSMSLLGKARQLVTTRLTAPSELKTALTAAAESASLAGKGSLDWPSAWSAICQVWASKWNDRAWLGRQAAGLAEDDLFMACLLQQVVAAEYAFVVHTANPLTGKRGEVFGEVVLGMGEALVGNFPGRALSFIVPEESSEPKILSLPAKRDGLFAVAASLIARSDSNGEDLEGFAGAGLYDSIPLLPLEARSLDYADEPLIWDSSTQQRILAAIAKAAREVEAAFGGSPQDIEGVYANGKLTIVQSRPQVL
ncbi:hypothetical protein WJX84_004122 [Apatococcus fuscideae]|uniref:Pyruvate phosphate dikinase AMP/ATP-binding domain-containing protein n=1 Tax=Apatococcus fuscideae TaxID=2026836 RepID=A0AAW1T2M5_9CHLO